MINYIDNDELPIGFTMELALHSDIPEQIRPYGQSAPGTDRKRRPNGEQPG